MTASVQGWVLINRLRSLMGLKPRPKTCCRKPENLMVIEVREPDLTIRRCVICRCRHFELQADAGKLGVRLNNGPPVPEV